LPITPETAIAAPSPEAAGRLLFSADPAMGTSHSDGPGGVGKRKMMNGRNVILTGIPRSGTTLSCALLNKLPDTVALHEPMRVVQLAAAPSFVCAGDEVDAFFSRMRQSLLTRHTAISKHIDGHIPDNHVPDQCGPNGLRDPITLKGEISFPKDLTDDFLLILKHPTAFTALLPELIRRFPCYAIIRNPLSVLGSWNSVNMCFRNGCGTAAETFLPQLAMKLSQIEDDIDRQLALLDFFYEQYRLHLPPEQVLPYEDIIASGGQSLRVINPAASELAEPLQSKNKNAVYSREALRRLGQRLLESEGAYWHFYSREAVAGLLAE
jgi:hypothetical protein